MDSIFYEIKSKDDFFILSKGHAGIALYVILEDFYKKNFDLDSYTQINSIFGVHPTKKIPQVITGTGSLGHGIGIGCGIAYFEKIKKSKQNVFILISDGELQEGSTWESLLVASNLKLDNLYIFVDLNDFQSFGRMSVNHPSVYPISDKLTSFGFETKTVDGHNHYEIIDAIKNMHETNKPKAIICNTIKGKGVSLFENNPIWHYRSPNSEELAVALRELEL